MKKPKLQVESPQPRQVQRADLAPTTGYAIVVDGHFKTEFVDEGAAKKAAGELLAKYPMLRIEIYNASSRSRTLLIAPSPSKAVDQKAVRPKRDNTRPP